MLALNELINPYLMNEFSLRYQLGESTFILGVLEVIFIFYHVSMKFLCANRIAPDGTPRSAASHLGLFCLPMSHKKDARLKRVKQKTLTQKYPISILFRSSALIKAWRKKSYNIMFFLISDSP